MYFKEDNKKIKKDIEKCVNTLKGYQDSILVFSNFMDDYFKKEENMQLHKEIYVEYKEFSNSIISVLKEQGFVKGK